MRNFILGFLCVYSLLITTTLADVTAVINGPTEARVGDLVVLSGRDSVGDNLKWVQPQKIQTLLCGDGKDLAFATGTPGIYSFILIVADKEADIDYVQHTVVVRGGVIEPDPEEPEKPTDPPPTFAELVSVSRESAKRLSDAETASGLAATIRATVDSLESRCDAGQCPGLDETKRVTVAAIEARLLQRTGNSRGVDWLNGWRVPVNAKLKEINAADVPTYLTAMRAVALGLAESL